MNTIQQAHILLVDDNTDLLRLLEEQLRGAGYQNIRTVQNCAAAQTAFAAEMPELMILDINLPDGDGFSLFRTLRAKADVPTLFLSARDADADRLFGLGLGADDYMTKPFSPSELVARVKAHLARYDRLTGSAVEKNKIIEIRGLRIDTTARRVWVNDVEKTFTTKEFDLLTFLASHPNHVYTKEELFREIWDMESIGDIATVTVHIKKIREKVEVDTSNPQYIETIWGVGYRFKV